MTVRVEDVGAVRTVAIDRPEVRNAVDRPTADALEQALLSPPDHIGAMVLTGLGGTFCAGADLHAATDPDRRNRLDVPERGPMGPTRGHAPIPVIAAIEGPAVAGGLELALWCDLRIVSTSAILGVFSRRIGVPLIDGGTVRLPRVVGHGRALELILTGRAVEPEEAVAIGLASQVVTEGTALATAQELAGQLAALPAETLRADLRATRGAFDLPLPEALTAEHDGGIAAIEAGGMDAGIRRFQDGEGRGGRPLT